MKLIAVPDDFEAQLKAIQEDIQKNKYDYSDAGNGAAAAIGRVQALVSPQVIPELPGGFVQYLEALETRLNGDGSSSGGMHMASAVGMVRNYVQKYHESLLATSTPHPIDKRIPQFWSRVGVVSEAAHEAGQEGHSVGTTNWASHILKKLYEAFPVDAKVIGENESLKRENMAYKIDVTALRSLDPEKTFKNLYDTTGNIGDINAYRVPAADLKAIMVSANRWIGLTQTVRIRILGSAGVHEKEVQGHKHDPNYVHFGAEFWTMYPTHKFDCTEQNAYGNLVLARYADASLNEIARRKEALLRGDDSHVYKGENNG